MNSHSDQIFAQAMAALRQGNLHEAELRFKSLLRSAPEHIAALNLLGMVLVQGGKFSEAENYFRKAIALNPNSDATFYNYGIALRNLKKLEEARDAFSKAIDLNPSAAENWNNRGAVFNDLKQYEEAVRDFEKVLSLKPDSFEAFSNLGKSFFLLGRRSEALEAYGKALQLKPDLAQAWTGYGNVLFDLDRDEEALNAYDKSLALNPNPVDPWLGRGNVLEKQGHHYEALLAYEEALKRKPDLAWVWIICGNIFGTLDRFASALHAFDKALALEPDNAIAWRSRGYALSVMKRFGEAYEAYGRAFSLNPDLEYLQGDLLHAQMQICHWKDIEDNFGKIIEGVKNSLPVILPFPFLSVPSSPELQLSCTKNFVARTIRPADPLWRGERYNHDRIRLAYMSSDFREHATSYLMAGLFEHHDRSRFETYAFSFTVDDDTPMQRRMKKCFDKFIDANKSGNAEVAKLMRDLEIDIVIDLAAFIKGSRTEILAARPAPVQLNYLVFPGTMGASFVDYIIADKILIPDGQSEYYSEKIVRLPHTYQPTDDTRAISAEKLSRADAGLPEKGFVFCCFNNTYKITPDIFEIWMRLLHRVDGSVLWLIDGNPAATSNLKQEAMKRGVSSERLIFAPQKGQEEHLARQTLADLFLDTLYYNAHTTASDALWAGLPLLTYPGSTFPARVAASVLAAIGLPELIVKSLEEYEALALALATDSNLLSSIRTKLIKNRNTFPLFDTRRYTRHLEAAYAVMWRRVQNGEPPVSFDIEAISEMSQ